MTKNPVHDRVIAAALEWTRCGGECKPAKCSRCCELDSATAAYLEAQYPHFDSEELESITKVIERGGSHDAMWWEAVARRMLATVEEPNNCYCGAAELASKYDTLSREMWEKVVPSFEEKKFSDLVDLPWSARLGAIIDKLLESYLVLPYVDHDELEQFGTTEERVAFIQGHGRLRGPKTEDEEKEGDAKAEEQA